MYKKQAIKVVQNKDNQRTILRLETAYKNSYKRLNLLN